MTSLRRVSTADAGVCQIVAAVTAMNAARPKRRTRTEGITGPSLEDLVERADQPARRQTVLDQSLTERSNPQLSDQRRWNHVARQNVRRANHTGQDDDVAIAVDVDLP